MFGLQHPVALAPVPGQAHARLAAAVSEAGGLGIVGAGAADARQIPKLLTEAGETAVACGLFCDVLSDHPDILPEVLRHRPRAICLSRGDPRRFSDALQRARVPIICVACTVQDAKRAVEAHADVIIAQGTGASGQSSSRTMFSLVPELADHIHDAAHDTLLLASGGVADSRTLAATIALGADGAVMGTRLFLSQEAGLSQAQQVQALSSDGDEALREASSFGQGIGLVRSVTPVADILNTVSRRAERILSHSIRAVVR
ncbi:MAG: nitronate monooxygenase [Pseudomonadota bacterium]